jgi:hypothetical protein
VHFAPRLWERERPLGRRERVRGWSDSLVTRCIRFVPVVHGCVARAQCDGARCAV